MLLNNTDTLVSVRAYTVPTATLCTATLRIPIPLCVHLIKIENPIRLLSAVTVLHTTNNGNHEYHTPVQTIVQV